MSNAEEAALYLGLMMQPYPRSESILYDPYLCKMSIVKFP